MCFYIEVIKRFFKKCVEKQLLLSLFLKIGFKSQILAILKSLNVNFMNRKGLETRMFCLFSVLKNAYVGEGGKKPKVVKNSMISILIVSKTSV